MNPEAARFCMACGTALAAARRATDAERKTITALFCDLVGSTELADGADPEDIDRLLRAYYAIARPRIESYGGTLEKFIGDAVVGVFGSPVAHEDDPERAIRAALRLIDEIAASGLPIHVRVGIMTGETLIRTDLDPAAGEGFATGDTLNIAARLQAQAIVDGVLVGEPTYRAAAPAFTWEDAGELTLKGRAQPMHGWRPMAPVARAGTELVTETTPFVGRDLELQTIVRIFERSRSTPSLEVVTIVADPGLGKSRLVRELARHLDDQPETVIWRSGRCLPYGDGVGFWALGEIVAAHAGILDTDDQAAIEAKLDAVLREPDPALRQWMRDRIGPLVGLQVTTAPPKEEEAFTAWRRFLEGIAHDGPLVLLIEDLHWADPALVSFLLHVVTTTAGLPITLLVTARPEVEERHAAWLSRARRSTVLSLTALPREAIAELVAAALPDADPELLDIVLERSAGSPLYADQLAAMLRSRAGPASALDEDAVPPTIQALLAARIDALPRDVKPVLLDASVVGRTFWSGAVARIGSRESEVVEPALTDLAQRELTRPSFPSTMEGEAEFSFWHALLRDVAYGELPRKARMEKHRFAAEWISERSAGSGRTAEIVAEHYTRALDLAIALDERDELEDLRAGLAAALLAAADQSMSTGPSQAVSHLRRAIDLLPEHDPRRSAAVSRLGEALYALSRYPEAREALGDAVERYRTEGNALAAAAIAPILALATANSGDPKLAEQLLEEARLGVADQPGPVLMSVMAEQAAMAMRADDHPVAIRLGQDILRMADELGLQPPPRALMAVGGDANYQRAIEIADATGDLRNSSIGRFNRAIHLRTDADTWIAVLDDAIAFDVNHGLPAGAAEHLKAAIAFFDLGRPEGTRELLADVADRAREIGDLFTVVLAEATLQEIRVVSGEPIGDLSEVIRLTREIGLNDVGPLDLMVMAALATGDLQAAGKALEALVADLEIHAPGDEPWSIVDQCLRAGDHALAVRAAAATRWVDGTGPIVDRPARELELATDDANVGRLAEADGDLATARERYEHGLAAYSRYDWRLPAARIGLWLGRCLIRMGEIDEGIARLRVAREESERIGLKPWVAEIDTVLAETGAQDAAPALR